MNRPFLTYLVLLAVLLGGWSLISGVRRVALPHLAGTGVMVLEGLLVVDALGAGAALLAGHRSGETGTSIGYLFTSVALLPLLVGTDREHWSPLRATVGCAGVTVVLIRLWMTWHA